MSNILRKIKHRGPDGSGIWLSNDERVLFGHKRLSILDLNQNANQPMIKLNGEVAIIFNGEIYNHSKLREELLACGVSFATDHSDTEVLINGYIYWGLDILLKKINGMFAFAIYDFRSNELHLCRDRIGIKNLFYSYIDNTFIFCSEIKGLLASKIITPELDKTYLNEYLLNRSLPAPHTLFKGVKKLNPGSKITINLLNNQLRESVYWNPLETEIDTSIKTQKDLEGRLESLIDSSVEYRLESDVPVGIFLSGGIDSSYLLAKLATKRDKIKCFTASFRDDKAYDESADAKIIANKYSANYIDVPIKAENYIDSLQEVVYYQEEPISAPVCVPVYHLAKKAREHNVPVIHAGEGSDEIFIGYENWLTLRKAQNLYNKVPLSSWLAKIAKPILNPLLNITSPQRDILLRASASKPLFWGGAMDINSHNRSMLLSSLTSEKESNKNIYSSTVESSWKRFLEYRSKGDISAWMTYMDLNHRLPELMLPRLDRMGMAHSIEGRVPYLDHRIVELMFATSENVKLEEANIGKPALKSIASGELGSEFVYRRKKGFQAPVSDWKEGSFSRYVALLELFVQRTEIFSLEGINLVVSLGGRRYFSLINFMLWYLIFIENVLKDKLPDLKRWDEY